MENLSRGWTMILRYMGRREWASAAVCALLIVLQVYLDLRIPQYMTEVTEAIGRSAPVSEVLDYGLKMAVCAIASFAVSVSAGFAAAYMASSLSRRLRDLTFDKVSGFTPGDVGRFSVESLITRCSNDISQVQNLVERALTAFIRAPIITVWALARITGSEWEWTAVSAGGVIVLVAAAVLIIRATRPRYRRIPEITDRINRRSLEHLSGLRVVRAYGAERFQEEGFERDSIDLMDNSIAIWKISALVPTLSSATSNLLTLAVYWTGISLISASSDYEANLVLFSDMVVFSSYMILVIGAFMQVFYLIQFSSRALASSKRVQELLAYVPSIPDGTVGDGDGSGSVSFEHVSFTYPGSPVPALDDVSFGVSGGGTLAIIGPTGSGKTTAARLMLRSYLPGSGTVRIDGVDIAEYRAESLRSIVSYVPQTSRLFTGTVESNINYGSTAPQRTEEDVEAAVRIAQASDFVESMPEGLSSDVQEGGRNLSGGQRQRVSIARAVCKDAEILVMDDPVSALDFATDRRLRQALSDSRPDATKVIITQRIGTVADADTIVVLDEGRVVGIGRHADLLKDCPLYREMAESQMEAGR